MSLSRSSSFLVALCAALPGVASAQLCPVVREEPLVPSGDLVGRSIGGALTVLGDPDGDGRLDVLAGLGDTPASAAEAGYELLSFHQAPDPAPGTLASAAHQPLPPGVPFSSGARFGASLASLGDLGGDGTLEVAFGAPGENQGAGGLYVVSLNPQTLAATASVRIASGVGGLGTVLQAGDGFGEAVSGVGDLDGDGHPDLAVGAPGSHAGDGAVWILFLDAKGQVLGSQEIAGGVGGLAAGAAVGAFGSALAPPIPGGDLNGDGVGDLAVGAPQDGSGAVWILQLTATGTAQASQRIACGSAGFVGPLAAGDAFGSALAPLGTPPGEGCQGMLAVGAPGAGDWASGQGAVWYLCLAADGTVQDEQRVSPDAGGFAGFPQGQDGLGSALAPAGDLDANQSPDLLAGAPGGAARTLDPQPVWSVLHGPSFQPRVVPYGTSNPGTLEVTAGLPYLGATLWFRIDHPGGTASGQAFLHVSPSADPAAPIGTPLGGYLGNALIDLSQSTPTPGAVWTPGNPVSISATMPVDLSLVGTSLFVQAAINTPAPIVVTNAIRLVLST